MAQQVIKIIVSVKISNIPSELLASYDPFTEGCFEIYKSLMEKHGNVFSCNAFKTYLKTLFIENEIGQEELFFGQNDTFSYDTVFYDDNFNEWINNGENKCSFLSKLGKTDYTHLIKKHKNQELYVIPVLNEDFHEDNLSYIEKIIERFENGNDKLYLLLHDKDIYLNGKTKHKATKNDVFEKDLGTFPKLKKSIEDGRVFVFQHDPAKDDYYNQIVLKLDTITIDEIIKILDYKDPNYILSDKIGKIMLKKDIEENLKKSNDSGVDFSKDFLDLENE